jgi:hypothetical protein
MHQINPQTGRPHRSLNGAWNELSLVELKAFVGITIILGVKRVTSLQDFWRRGYKLKLRSQLAPRHDESGPPLGSTGRRLAQYWCRRERASLNEHTTDIQTLCCSAIGRHRFVQIQRYLHLCGPDRPPLSDEDWFKKIEPLSSRIRQRCVELVIPATECAVDEMMIRFHGRSKHTVRMPKKPIKEGFKVFAICQGGYTYNLRFTSPKTGIAELQHYPGLATTQSVVLDLAKSVPYDLYDFTIYMDNLFTTVPLLEMLRENNIGGAGTTWVHHFPKQLQVLDEKTTRWNDLAGGAVPGIDFVAGLEWHDQRIVKMLTTVHDIGKRVAGTRKQPKRTSTNGRRMHEAFTAPVINALIPDVISAYNHNKGGVDNADHVCHSIQSPRIIKLIRSA